MHHLDPVVASAEVDYRRDRLANDYRQVEPAGTAVRRHRRRHANRQRLW